MQYFLTLSLDAVGTVDGEEVRITGSGKLPVFAFESEQDCIYVRDAFISAFAGTATGNPAAIWECDRGAAVDPEHGTHPYQDEEGIIPDWDERS